MTHIKCRLKYAFLCLAVIIGAFQEVPVHAMQPWNTELGIAVASSLIYQPDSVVDKRMSDMKRLGARWVRVDIDWNGIQQESAEQFDWYGHDKIMDAAKRNGLKVLATIAYTPAWARDNVCGEIAIKNHQAPKKCTPRDPASFATFAGQLAEHYKGSTIRAWEIWNEPNLIGYYKVLSSSGRIWVDPVRLAVMADLSAAAIHAVTPGVQVITGGMAPVFRADDTRGIRQADFLKAMLPYLKKGNVTAIGIHPYTRPAFPHQVAEWNSFYTVNNGLPQNNLSAILADAGRTDLSIWGTEYGASTASVNTKPLTVDPAAVANSPIKNYVTEQDQATMIQEGVDGWYKKPNVGPLFIHSDGDAYLQARSNENGFGLRRPDGSAKPSYYALLDASQRLGAWRATFAAVLPSMHED